MWSVIAFILFYLYTTIKHWMCPESHNMCVVTLRRSLLCFRALPSWHSCTIPSIIASRDKNPNIPFLYTVFLKFSFKDWFCSGIPLYNIKMHIPEQWAVLIKKCLWRKREFILSITEYHNDMLSVNCHILDKL